MKIIPVLDILNGVAVHAVRGERKEYRPLKSILCASADPVAIAKAFSSFGFDELYVADLDAILKTRANFAIYEQIIAQTDLSLIVDAGINSLEKAERVLGTGVSRIIIGTETLNDLDFIRQAIKSVGKDRVIVSLDLKGEKVLSRSEAVKSESPVSLAETFEKMSVNKIIILDLTRVGAETGVNLALVKAVLSKTKLEVLTGGGVRDTKDLEELRNAGVSAALIATVLHTGKLTLEELKSTGFL